MNRALAVTLRLLIAIAVALALLGLWLQNLPEAARQLFLFMDIGLGVWLVLLIVGAVRGWGIRALAVSAVIGAVLNLLTVTVVGLVQTGALPWEFIGWAAESGIAFLIGAAVALAVVKPRRSGTTAA
ncbi:hypothetical protein BH11ACT5_BH11ACT5_23660 [soil metagenome]